MNPYKAFLLLFLNISLLVLNSFAQQAPGIEWQKCLGGSDREFPNSIQQTVDGGYIVAGYTESNDSNVSGNHGGRDCWIVKMDSIGNILWQKCFGGTNDDYASCILQDQNGGYIITGSTESNNGDVSGNHGGGDIWILKIDSVGNLEWQKCYGGTGDERSYEIHHSFANGYIIAGATNSNNGDVSGNHGWTDYWIIKIDSIGNIQWQKCFGGSLDDYAMSVKQTADSGYIVGGSAQSNDGNVSGNHTTFGYVDFWIIKLDSSGALLWQKCFGGSNDDVLYSINELQSGDFIASGGTASNNNGDVSGFHGAFDFWIIKITSNGLLEWQKCFGGTYDEIAYSMQTTQDLGFILSGFTWSNDYDVSGNHSSVIGVPDVWVTKIDSSGNLLWQKCLGGTSGEYSAAVYQTQDNGYALANYSFSNDGDVTGNIGDYDYWIVKLLPDTITGISPTPTLPDGEGVAIAPNPSNGIFQITFPNFSKVSNFGKVSCDYTLAVINTLGQTVFSSDLRLPTSDLQTNLDLSFLPKGIYVLKIIDGENSFSKKLIIQ